MKKTLFIIALFAILFIKANAQSCNTTGGCSIIGHPYPDGTTLTPTTSWATHSSMNGGNWTLFSVTCGNTYDWTYCSSYGGANEAWDAQLTLYDYSSGSTGALLCFQDNSGLSGCPNAPYLRWPATFTGTVQLLTTVASCQSNSGSPYSTLGYRIFTTGNCPTCTTPGTPASATGTQTGQTSANLSWTAGSPIGSSTVTYYWVVGTSSTVTYGGNGVVAQGTTNGTSATTSGLTCGTTYYLRVYAKTSCDGKSSGYRTSSSFSTPTCTTTCTTPGTPASATGIQTGQTSANLTWTAGSPIGSPSVTYYWVVGTSSSVSYGGSGVVAQGTSTGTSATTSALTCGTTYYLRVYAKTSCDGSISAYRTSSAFTTSACSGPTVYGIDVSHWQKSITWEQVYASGKVVFAYAKCSEGLTGPDDDFFTYNMPHGKSAGIVMGAYHIAHPDNRPSISGAIAEANHFLSIASLYIGPGYMPPALDLEPAYVESVSKSDLSKWIQAWITTVENATQIAPIIYCTHSDASNFIESSLNIYELWIANYITNPLISPTNLGNWTEWKINQYNGGQYCTGTSPGIIGPVDLDVFNGDISAFNNFIGGGSGCSQPTNDNCSGNFSAFPLTFGSTCNPVKKTSCGATSSGFNSCSGTQDDDVFFSFIPTSSSATITVQSLDDYDAVFQVLNGPCGSSMTEVTNGCVDNTSGGGIETTTVSGLTTGSTYFIRVWHYFSGYGTNGNFTICVTGTAAPSPAITTSITSLSDFGSVQVGTNSSPQNFNVTGSSLTANITLSASSGFQISTSSSSSFGSTVTLTQSAGSVSSTPIYVRFSPANTGIQSGSISLTSTGATTKYVSVSGTGTAAPSPTITASQTSLSDFSNVQVGTNSSPQNFNVSGSSLTANITLSAPSGFQISTSSSSSFGSTVTLTQSAGSVSSTPIYVRFSPASTGIQSGSISLTSTGATTKYVSVSGTGIGTSSYCSVGSSFADEYISNVILGTINQTSNIGTAGYQDFTAQSTTLQIGENASVTITLGVGYTSDQILIWVDWNKDGDFIDAGENVYASNNLPYLTSTASFTVPSGATPGTTRMRIRLHDTANGPNATPCGNSSYGEVEDYSVNVINATATPTVSDGGSIRIYPNPTTGKFEISEIESLGNECKVEIINNLGSLIYISIYKNFGNKISLDLSPYTEGLYLIKLSNNEVSYQKKVIKK